MSDSKVPDPNAPQSHTSDHGDLANDNNHGMQKCEPEVDDFGLPKRPMSKAQHSRTDSDSDSETFHDAQDSNEHLPATAEKANGSKGEKDEIPMTVVEGKPKDVKEAATKQAATDAEPHIAQEKNGALTQVVGEPVAESSSAHDEPPPPYKGSPGKQTDLAMPQSATPPTSPTRNKANLDSPITRRSDKNNQPAISDWSHMTLANRKEAAEEEEEVQWQAMSTLR